MSVSSSVTEFMEMHDAVEELVGLNESKWMQAKSDCMFSGVLMVTVFAFRGFFWSGPGVAGCFVVRLLLCLY